LKMAMLNNDDALKCLTYDLASKNKQVKLLKMWKMSDDDILSLKGGIVNG